jgi:hypothetical protein
MNLSDINLAAGQVANSNNNVFLFCPLLGPSLR